MPNSSDAFLGVGFHDALTRRQVLQAGLAGAATIGLAACGQTEPTGGGTTGPDFKVGAVLPSSKVYAELGTSITNGMKLYFDKAGSKAAAAFKETFTGTILAEVKPPLNNQDYSTYISQIRASKPEAIYFFLSGTDANNFFTQAKQVDLFANIKVTGAGFGVEQDVTQAIGDKSPVGAITGLHWAYTLDNKENKDFTTAYKSKYGRLADVFAMQGYDTARVIIEALNAVKGKTDDKQAFLKAIAAVKFKSPRGDFRFDPATNNVVNPIYIRELVKY